VKSEDASGRRIGPVATGRRRHQFYMSENQGLPDQPEPENGQRARWLMPARALLGIAILGAGYLAWVALAHGSLAGCGTGSGCNKVLQSRWAYWLHLPVSVPALLVYLALLGATVLARKRTAPDDERGAWAAIIALSVIVAGAALWFVGLQVFVLKAFCPFCMAAHVCGLAAAFLCLKNIPLASDPATPMWSAAPDKRGVPRAAVFSLILIGLAVVAVLAGGQWLVPEQRNVVKLLPVRPSAVRVTHSTLAASGGQSTNRPSSPNAHLVAPRLLSLYNNQFLIRLDDVPMIGSPGASNVIVNLFDYTCPHCRELHWILVVAQRQFSNDLGIVSLPMPMSTNCNPLIPPDFNSSPNACDLARLGLAVWRAKPEAHRQFDDWFFSADEGVSVEEARKYAAQLVGTDKLEKALSDPWVDKQILTDCQLHFSNWQATGRPGMPQLILGGAVSIGPLNSVEHLQALLNRYLGLDPGQNRF